MTEDKPNQPSAIDPSLTFGSTDPVSPELSAERIERLKQVVGNMEGYIPGYLGVTLFGSTARGEARSDSDVDIFLLVEPDEGFIAQDFPDLPTDEWTYRVESGAMAGTRMFERGIDGSYNWFAGDHFHKADLNADVLVLPISREVIDEAMKELLEVAGTWDSGDKSIGARVPRNISALFQMPIKTDRLQPYINQVMGNLAGNPNASTAWRMIRHQVVFFEAGKTQEARDKGLSRFLPETIEEAEKYFDQKTA